MWIKSAFNHGARILFDDTCQYNVNSRLYQLRKNIRNIVSRNLRLVSIVDDEPDITTL